MVAISGYTQTAFFLKIPSSAKISLYEDRLELLLHILHGNVEFKKTHTSYKTTYVTYF